MKILLNKVISQQKEELRHMLGQARAPRARTAELSKLLKSSLIKVVTGPRRAGKSTLALQVLEGSKFAYFNFEDDLLSEDVDTEILMECIMENYDNAQVIFFDEVQHLKRWEQLANKLHRRGFNLIVTGSNSELLKGDLASSLTGRHVELRLLPFSFKEYFKYKSQQTEQDQQNIVEEFYDSYESLSGYPDLLIKGENPELYLESLFDSIILRDIVRQKKIRNPALIMQLFNRLVHSICSKISYRQLEKDLGNSLSVNTIKKYMHYANEAYLFAELQPYFFKPRMRMKSDRKLYAMDHGYINHKTLSIIGKHSALMENIVFLELLRRGYQMNSSLFYYVTKEGYEVDFFTRPSSTSGELIQVSYNVASSKTRTRELRALTSAARELGVSSCKLITRHQEEVEIINGVKIEMIKIWKWLINQDMI
jgi:uncharacterized protein